jgi:6-phosphogluconate dehydrogenase
MPEGLGLVGPSGAGHYVKMIHNGIEYALLQSYAEGYHLLKENKRFDELDLEQISNIWLHGSVIRSWILELAAEIFEQDQSLETISGVVGENKTGRWTLIEAKEQKISVPMLEQALERRDWSRSSGGNYSTKLVAMLRHKFGGHPVGKLQDEAKKYNAGTR